MNPRHVIIIFLATFLVFGNTFFNSWTYDDMPVVVENPDAHSVAGFLKDSLPGRPLRELTHIPEYMLFKDNPAGYRIQQLFWHGANGALLYILFCVLGLLPRYALPGALLFIVHPLQVESVAGIANRKELLALFFSFVSLLCCIRMYDSSTLRRCVFALCALGAFCLALFGNQTALTLPLVIVLYEWLLVPEDRRIFIRYPRITAVVAIIGTALIFYRYRYLFQPQTLLAIYSKNSFPSGRGYFPLFMADLKAFGFYIHNIFFPFRLAPEYVIRFSSDFFQWQSCLSAILLSFLTCLGFHLRKNSPLISFGIGFFFIFYIPVSNILPVAYIVADRYMYLCLPGVALVATCLLQRFSSKPLNLAYSGLLLLFASLSIIQNTCWRDEHTLWRHAVRVNPDSTWVRETAAQSYLMTGELAQAKEHIQKSLELDRFNILAYLTRGKIEEELGNLDEAIQSYQQFLLYGGKEYPLEVAQLRFRVEYLKGLVAQSWKK